MHSTGLAPKNIQLLNIRPEIGRNHRKGLVSMQNSGDIEGKTERLVMN